MFCFVCLFGVWIFLLQINWILANAFPASVEIFMFFLHYLLQWYISLIEFSDVEPSLYMSDKAFLVMMHFKIYFWILFANISFWIFAILLMGETGWKFSFVVLSLSGFIVNVLPASLKEFGSIFHPILWNSLYMKNYLIIRGWQTLPVKAIWAPILIYFYLSYYFSPSLGIFCCSFPNFLS